MSEFNTAFSIAPHSASQSKGGFFLPPTITTDFSAFLMQDTPGFTYTAKLVRDWTKQGENDTNPFIRCVMYPINWKSNFAAADEGVNFRTDFSHKIQKGDYVIREDGEVYLLNWAVHNQVNNQPSQAKRCNHTLTIKRSVPEKVDNDGFLVEPAQEVTFINEMPVAIYQYDGRPDYQSSFNTPGISADALTIIDMQWNESTRQIRINDEFYWGTQKLRVININLSGVNISETAGMLQIHARHVAGGDTIGY